MSPYLIILVQTYSSDVGRSVIVGFSSGGDEKNETAENDGHQETQQQQSEEDSKTASVIKRIKRIR